VIYVAGPYSAQTKAGVLANIDRAMAAGAELVCRGFAVIVPHFWGLSGAVANVDYEGWMSRDFAILEKCDGLFWLPALPATATTAPEPSPGTARELALARSLGIPVFRHLDSFSHYDWSTRAPAGVVLRPLRRSRKARL